jgi:hypothetical protein
MLSSPVSSLAATFLVVCFLVYARNAYLKYVTKNVGMSTLHKDQDMFRLPALSMCGCIDDQEEATKVGFVVKATHDVHNTSAERPEK